MKKRILALALLLLLCLSGAALAESITITTDTGFDTSTVTYTVGQTFTLNIPATAAIGLNKTGTSSISVSAAVIPYGKRISVKLTASTNHSDSKFYLKNSAEGVTDTIEYTIGKGEDAVALDGEVLSVPAGTATLSQSLTYTVTGAAQYANTYSDTLTFTATIVEP